MMSSDNIVKCPFCYNDITNISDTDWTVYINHIETCPEILAENLLSQYCLENENPEVVNLFFPNGNYKPSTAPNNSSVTPSSMDTTRNSFNVSSSSSTTSSLPLSSSTSSEESALENPPKGSSLYTHPEGSEIIPRIYLTSVILGKDPKWLKDHNITTVINCIDKRESRPLSIELQNEAGIQKYVCLDMDDSFEGVDKINLGVTALKEAYDAGENIVVHCAAGRSRSATVLMSFLLQHGSFAFFPQGTTSGVLPRSSSSTALTTATATPPRWTLKDVIVLVKKRRPVVAPNLGFCTYLINLEKQCSDDGKQCAIPETLLLLHKENLTYVNRLKLNTKI